MRWRGERPGQALVFSEQDLPGYKAKPFSWELLDDDGNPGQGRSQLFEKRKRDQQRKENDGRFEPYKRKPIPKKTALVGTVVRELEADPVKNKDYEVIEDMKARISLMPKEHEGTKIYRTSEGLATEKILSNTYMATAEQKRAALKVSLARVCVFFRSTDFRRNVQTGETVNRRPEEPKCLRRTCGSWCASFSNNIQAGR